jgi:ribonuclease G
VEPHMYDVDDAVAKIDGYIISIAGAAPHVGEKRMVRIDQVGRTAASAQLLDESGEVVAPQDGSAQRERRRAPSANGGDRRSTKRSRGRGRRVPGDVEDAEARREAGLSESPTTVDSEPEEEPSPAEEPAKPAGDGASDRVQSKPRRRGRRGGRRRSAAGAKAR